MKRKILHSKTEKTQNADKTDLVSPSKVDDTSAWSESDEAPYNEWKTRKISTNSKYIIE